MEQLQKAILCVSSDPTILHLRQLLLERFGYRVYPASRLQDASSLASYHCPDILLMDYSFSIAELEELAQGVKQICPDLMVAVVAPYFAMPGVNGRSIDRFISIDESPGVIISSIREMLGEERELPEDSGAKK